VNVRLVAVACCLALSSAACGADDEEPAAPALDGEPQVLTEDFQPARINVRVRDNAVARVEFMG
jgi:hypothetical protein